MAVSELIEFNQRVMEMTTAMGNEQASLFNAASNGAIVLDGVSFVGSTREKAYFAYMNDIVRGRDPSSTDTIEKKRLRQIAETAVKIGRGSKELEWLDSEFQWLKMNPGIAAAQFSKMLAEQIIEDQVNVGVSALVLNTQAQGDELTRTIPGQATFQQLNRTTQLLGDKGNRIAAWVMHSTPMYDLYDQALNNNERLFTYGTVNVQRDPFGRVIIMVDLSALEDGDVYNILGLQKGAVHLGAATDWNANEERKNGQENIVTTYQSEWTYTLDMMGYSWAGKNKPKDPDLMTAANWERIDGTRPKDLGAVMLRSGSSTDTTEPAA